MAVKTKFFTETDLEDALDMLEAYCSNEDIVPDDVISVNVISRDAEKETTVVLVFDDCLDDD